MELRISPLEHSNCGIVQSSDSFTFEGNIHRLNLYKLNDDPNGHDC